MVPRLLMPDNLKSGVNKASFYDPEINRSYAAMAANYRVGVLPAWLRRPRDKVAVEAGVRFAQSYIVGRLRNVTFFPLGECNAAIAVALEGMDNRGSGAWVLAAASCSRRSSGKPFSPLPPK